MRTKLRDKMSHSSVDLSPINDRGSLWARSTGENEGPFPRVFATAVLARL